ncbi:hypothetical protein HF319_15270 [Xanthomonas sp. Kuri4-1]
MSTRRDIDRELDHLAEMLTPWLQQLRHRNQFWPQFEALAGEIIGHCERCDRFHAERRLLRMLQRHQLQRRRAAPRRPGRPH